MSRIISKTTEYLYHAEKIMSTKLIQIMTNRDGPGEITRRAFSLPVKNRGLTINQPDDNFRNYSVFQNLSAKLDDPSFDLIILEQDRMKKKDTHIPPENNNAESTTKILTQQFLTSHMS